MSLLDQFKQVFKELMRLCKNGEIVYVLAWGKDYKKVMKKYKLKRRKKMSKKREGLLLYHEGGSGLSGFTFRGGELKDLASETVKGNIRTCEGSGIIGLGGTNREALINWATIKIKSAISEDIVSHNVKIKKEKKNENR